MKPNLNALAAGAVAAVVIATAAYAAGIYTNGLPLLGSLPSGYTQLAANGGPLLPVDTNLAGGASPQSIAVSPFQVAATFGDAIINTSTSTVHAATSNTKGGVITTEALTTAAGATYTFTLTNSLITLSPTVPQPQVAIYSGSNTAAGPMALTSSTNAAGSVVWVWTNNGPLPLNGTMVIVWHI